MIDFTALPRPQGREITRMIKGNGHEIEVTLARLQPDENLAVGDLTESRIKEYLPQSDTPAKTMLTPIGGKSPKLSKSLIYSATRLEQMQRGPAEARYPFVQLVAMTITATELWNALQALSDEVDEDPKPEKKPDGQASETPPSEPI